MRLFGLDVSLSTGFSVVDCSNKVFDLQHLSTVHYKKEANRIMRVKHYADYIVDACTQYAPDVALIEDYSYQSAHNLATMVEVGTMVRFALQAKNVPYLEISPGSLKKFVTGVGNCKKDLILKEVYKRWGLDVKDDNQADAYGLARIGYSLFGFDDDITLFQKDALKAIKNQEGALSTINSVLTAINCK